MFCSKCGTKNNDDDLYCYKCGSSLAKAESVAFELPSDETNNAKHAAGGTVPYVKSKKSYKGIVIGVAVAAVLVAATFIGFKLLRQPDMETAVAVSDTGTTEDIAQSGESGNADINTPDGSLSSGIYEEDFATPEEAIEHFIKSVANNDFKGAIAATVVNEAGDNYNATEFAVNAEYLIYTMEAPSEYEFYQELNRAQSLAIVANQMKFFVYSFSDSDAVLAVIKGEDYSLNSKDEAEQFVADVDPDKLKELHIMRIDSPSENSYYSNIIAGTYGADKSTDRIVLYELNGETYLGGYTLLFYDNRWGILGLYSDLGDTSPYGAAEKISEEAYEHLLD